MDYLEDRANAQADEADDALLWMLENGFDAKTVERQEKWLTSYSRKRNMRNASDEQGRTYDPDSGKVLSNAKLGGSVPGWTRRVGQVEIEGTVHTNVGNGRELTSRATGKVAKRRQSGTCTKCGLTPCSC